MPKTEHTPTRKEQGRGRTGTGLTVPLDVLKRDRSSVSELVAFALSQ